MVADDSFPCCPAVIRRVNTSALRNNRPRAGCGRRPCDNATHRRGGRSGIDESVQAPFLPAVQGTRINSGKKTSVIDLDEFPRIINNNYRQALAKTPGLFLSEETSPLISIGYRGLDPSRVQYTQVLKDGIPIHADQFGYPEAYYTPPLDTVDRIEFLRGGAALITARSLAARSISSRTGRARIGAFHSARRTSSEATTTIRPSPTLMERAARSVTTATSIIGAAKVSGRATATSISTPALKLVLGATTDSRWILTLEGYAEQHGEPGGLTFATGPGAVNYNVDRNATSRFYDQFRARALFRVARLGARFFGSDEAEPDRLGRRLHAFQPRQRGGGFGTLPTGRNREQHDDRGPGILHRGVRSAAAARLRLWGGRTPSRAACRCITRFRRVKIGAADRQCDDAVRCGTTTIARSSTFRSSSRTVSTGARSRSRQESVREYLARRRRAREPRQVRRRHAAWRARRTMSSCRSSASASPMSLHEGRGALRQRLAIVPAEDFLAGCADRRDVACAERSPGKQRRAIRRRFSRQSRPGGLRGMSSAFLLDFDDQIGTSLCRADSARSRMLAVRSISASKRPASWT